MKSNKLVIGVGLVVIAAIVGIYFGLRHELALVTHPKGTIAHGELKLIAFNVFLMLCIILPTVYLILHTLWKNGKNTEDKPEKKSSTAFREVAFWTIPAIFVAVLATVTWKETHRLDPYAPLQNENAPLKIQVVAMDWKWLFIYPELGIATLNYVHFPEQIPIDFELSADGSPMNSFWIPELSGQIYAMTGMITPLHIMADGPGEYSGKAAEINGQGYASMTFTAKSSSLIDFNQWIDQVKQSPQQLTEDVYNKLLVPSENDPVTLYSYIEPHLFHKIVMKPMHPAH